MAALHARHPISSWWLHHLLYMYVLQWSLDTCQCGQCSKKAALHHSEHTPFGRQNIYTFLPLLYDCVMSTEWGLVFVIYLNKGGAVFIHNGLQIQLVLICHYLQRVLAHQCTHFTQQTVFSGTLITLACSQSHQCQCDGHTCNVINMLNSHSSWRYNVVLFLFDHPQIRCCAELQYTIYW